MPDKDAAAKPTGVAEALRKYVDAVASMTEVPRERAEKIVRDLAERGEVRARDLQKAASELAERSARNRQELIGLVRKEIRRQISALGVATKTDVDRLNKRIRALETSKPPKSSAAKSKPKGNKNS